MVTGRAERENVEGRGTRNWREQDLSLDEEVWKDGLTVNDDGEYRMNRQKKQFVYVCRG